MYSDTYLMDFSLRTSFNESHESSLEESHTKVSGEIDVEIIKILM